MRIIRMNEYKRKKILEKHKFLKEKNEEKRLNISLMQNQAISKNIAEQETQKFILNLIDKLKREEATKSGEDLKKTIKEFYKSFDIGMPINIKS